MRPSARRKPSTRPTPWRQEEFRNIEVCDVRARSVCADMRAISVGPASLLLLLLLLACDLKVRFGQSRISFAILNAYLLAISFFFPTASYAYFWFCFTRVHRSALTLARSFLGWFRGSSSPRLVLV